MLEEVIASRSRGSHGHRIALAIQRLARFVAIPAGAVMLGGLVAHQVSGGSSEDLLSHAVLPLGTVFSREVLSPHGAMSVGLLALALLPMANVLYILVDSLIHRRWSDARAAGAVAAILVTGILLGRA